MGVRVGDRVEEEGTKCNFKVRKLEIIGRLMRVNMRVIVAMMLKFNRRGGW